MKWRSRSGLDAGELISRVLSSGQLSYSWICYHSRRLYVNDSLDKLDAAKPNSGG